MAIYFRTLDLTVDTITLTVTHGCSRTPANLRVRLTAKNMIASTAGTYVPTIGTNIILIRAGLDGAVTDVEVMEVHSIQGGPNG